MGRFAIRRVASMLLVLFAISILTFLIFQKIPNGDPALRIAGRTASPENIASVRHTWGFDRPIWDQYLITMQKVFTGNVISYTQRINVLDQIRRGLPATISLALGAGVIWLFWGIVLGVVSAVKAGRFSDRALAVLSLAGISTPVFVVGAVLLYVVAFLIPIFPNGGYVPLTQDPFQWFTHLILPWFTLSVLFIGFYSRVLRSNMLDAMGDDFVRTARAKGLSEHRVLVRHVLRTSLIPIVSLWGLDFAAVIGGGAIITETVFNLQGVGQYAAQSIQALDVPPVLVIVMFAAFAVVFVAALIDILYAYLDPADPAERLMAPHLLEVDDLRVSFTTEEGVVRGVDGVSFTVDPGELLGIVGESGSGKSVTAMTLLGLTRSPNATIEGAAYLEGLDLVRASEAELRRVRGARVAMIFQDPMTALNPVQRVGGQIVEQIRAHEHVSKAAAMDRAVQLLERVGIPRARDRVRAYPHEFSGGMRQRVMIAMALSCSPQVLIADEPTTALDVTIQAQILAEIEDLRRETGVAVILVTHDLGVVADVADRVVVMYGGRVVEEGSLTEIFYDPQHPYTWGLLGSVPRADRSRPERLPTIPGQPPSLLRPPDGCHFQPRCPHRTPRCAEVPPLDARLEDHPLHKDRCWLEVADKRRLRLVGEGIGLTIAQGAGA